MFFLGSYDIMYVEFGRGHRRGQGDKGMSSLECLRSLAQWLTQAPSWVKFLASRGGEDGPRGSRVVAACPLRDRSGRIFCRNQQSRNTEHLLLGDSSPAPPWINPAIWFVKEHIYAADTVFHLNPGSAEGACAKKKRSVDAKPT